MLDFGTTHTVVAIGREPRVVREPSRIALKPGEPGTPPQQNKSNGQGHSPDRVWVRPVECGRVVNSYAMESLLKNILEETRSGFRLMTLRRVAGVIAPPNLSEDERSNLRAMMVDLGFGKVHMISEPFASARGLNLDVSDARGRAVVDLGGGTTTTSVFSMGGLVNWHQEPSGGRLVDQTIAEYIRARYLVDVPFGLSEEIKIKLGSLHPQEKPAKFSFKGIESVSRLPKNINLDDNEIRDVMVDAFENLVRGIQRGLERLPPELAGDIAREKILLIGGGAKTPGLIRFLEERLGLEFEVAADPENITVMGARVLMSSGLMDA